MAEEMARNKKQSENEGKIRNFMAKILRKTCGNSEFGKI